MTNKESDLPDWVRNLLTLGLIFLLGYLLSKLFSHLFPLKRKPRVFISHSWKNEKDYWNLIKKFDQYNFEFYDHSIPSENSLPEKNTFKIEKGIRNKIIMCSKILVLGGSYSNNYWIKKEIEIAKKLNKEIIAIKPWGKKTIPHYLKTNADQVLGFNTKSIIEEIKK